jgi:hypothetical protein
MLPRLLPRRLLLQALTGAAAAGDLRRRVFSSSSSAASSPSLSIWRRKKEMGKEGLMVVAQLKRLAALPPAGRSPRLEQFMRSHVSRLLRTDLLAVLAELLRQDHVVLSMKVQVPFPFLSFPICCLCCGCLNGTVGLIENCYLQFPKEKSSNRDAPQCDPNVFVSISK